MKLEENRELVCSCEKKSLAYFEPKVSKNVLIVGNESTIAMCYSTDGCLMQTTNGNGE